MAPLTATFRRSSVKLAASTVVLLCMAGCRVEGARGPTQVSYNTHLVLLESGIHWAEWIKQDGTPCGDIYKWNDSWIADTYPNGGLDQHPVDTKDQAIAWVQAWCK